VFFSDRLTDQLTKQFKAKAMEIQPPAGHEINVRELYEADQKRGRHSKSLKPVLLKVGLALVLVAAITGFTSYLWLKISDDRVSLQYSQSINRVYDEALSSKIHNDLEEVEAKLGVGEMAVVYLPDLAKLLPGKRELLLIAVSNPSEVTDLSKWEAILANNMEKYKLPPVSWNGLKFVGGKEAPPFGGFLSSEWIGLLPELKRESEANEGKAVWRKQVNKSSDQPREFTTIYHNERLEEIYISIHIINQKTDFKISSGYTENDEMNINGAKAHYFKTQPFFLSDSNRVQEIVWLETFPDYSLVYSVGSSDPKLSKDELLRVANAIK
jgi:hypothetical protein